jgi:TolB-like protein
LAEPPSFPQMPHDIRESLQKTLGSGYRLGTELGGGGMSRVFLAEDLTLGRRVVVKVLPPELAADVSVQRFNREVQVAARLQHPHIVSLHSAGEVNGLPYYTMPFIEGESLRARISRGGELPVGEAVRIIRDVAAALAHAHALGVVHRDIKPENILLSGGEAMVTDFGVARAVSAATASPGGLTSVGVALGTPAYMAPEQATADPATDHRADIYALGVVAYEVLAGRAPFAGRAPQALLAAHAIEEPEPLARLRPSVPAELAALVHCCLAKRPADRPQTATELVQALDGIQTSGTTRSFAAAPGAPATGRRGAVLAGGALLAAALGVIAFTVTRAPSPSVDPSASVIAVLPLTPTSPDSMLTRLGRDLAVTLSANLDGVGNLRTLDAVSVLAHLLQSGDAAGMAVAERLGATAVVQGTLLRVGGQVRADVAVFRLGGGADGRAAVERASAVAPAEEIAALTDSLTWALLRQLWQSGSPPTPSITGVTTRSMPAFRAFLDGERAVAGYDFTLAAASYAEAIARDSTFWLAYARYRWASAWMFEPIPPVITERLFANLANLPERERLQLEAGREPLLSRRLELRRELTRRFPDHWPVWLDYGDMLLHDAPLIGTTREEAIAPFQRVVDLNPQFTPGWEHLMMASHDFPDRIRAVLDTLSVLRPSEPLAPELGFDVRLHYEVLSARTAEERATAVDRLASALAVANAPPGLRWVYGSLIALAAGAPVQTELSTLVLRKGAAVSVAPIHREGILRTTVARGSWTRGTALAEEFIARDGSPLSLLTVYEIAVIGEWLGGDVGDLPDRVRARLGSAALDRDETARVAWLDGLRAHTRGDSISVQRLAAAIRDLGSVESEQLSGGLRMLGGTARVEDAELRAALAREWRLAERPDDNYGPALAVQRLVLARGLRETGQADDSARLLNWTDGVITAQSLALASVLLGPVIDLERARAEVARGDRTRARRFYERFLRDFDSPDASQRHLVEEARTELAQLGDARPAGAVR